MDLIMFLQLITQRSNLRVHFIINLAIQLNFSIIFKAEQYKKGFVYLKVPPPPFLKKRKTVQN